jgi:hypothetical protein
MDTGLMLASVIKWRYNGDTSWLDNTFKPWVMRHVVRDGVQSSSISSNKVLWLFTEEVQEYVVECGVSEKLNSRAAADAEEMYMATCNLQWKHFSAASSVAKPEFEKVARQLWPLSVPEVEAVAQVTSPGLFGSVPESPLVRLLVLPAEQIGLDELLGSVAEPMDVEQW